MRVLVPAERRLHCLAVIYPKPQLTATADLFLRLTVSSKSVLVEVDNRLVQWPLTQATSQIISWHATLCLALLSVSAPCQGVSGLSYGYNKQLLQPQVLLPRISFACCSTAVSRASAAGTTAGVGAEKCSMMQPG